MSERSKFEFIGNPYCIYDPVLRLRVGFEPGRREIDELCNGNIGIHHDPEIEPSHYMMPQPEYPPLEYEARKKMKWDFDRLVPFKSSRSVCLARLPYRGESCGDRIRLKVIADGSGFRSYHLRGSIERLKIPLVSSDVSSMYMGVMKAYPGLRILRDEYPPGRFPNARSIEICVTTSGLTQGLGRSAEDYPMVEPPKPGAQRPTGSRSASVEAALMTDEGWHSLASWPMQI